MPGRLLGVGDRSFKMTDPSLISKSDIQGKKIIQASEIRLLTSMKKRDHNFNRGNKQSFLSI